MGTRQQLDQGRSAEAEDEEDDVFHSNNCMFSIFNVNHSMGCDSRFH